MSISTQIARLQQAKADIKSAIENKGVTVPSSALLDTYDDYVGQIVTTPTLQSKTATANGTVTPDSGYDGLSSVTVNVPYPTIQEISTDAGMSAVLTSENVGKAYKFTGTTGTYINGDIYVVEEQSSGIQQITISATYPGYSHGDAYYKLNDGTATYITTATMTLTNVTKLEVMYDGNDVSYIEVDGTEIPNTSPNVYYDITSYLVNNSDVYVYTDD